MKSHEDILHLSLSDLWFSLCSFGLVMCMAYRYIWILSHSNYIDLIVCCGHYPEYPDDLERNGFSTGNAEIKSKYSHMWSNDFTEDGRTKKKKTKKQTHWKHNQVFFATFLEKAGTCPFQPAFPSTGIQGSSCPLGSSEVIPHSGNC